MLMYNSDTQTTRRSEFFTGEFTPSSEAAFINTKNELFINLLQNLQHSFNSFVSNLFYTTPFKLNVVTI